jgi:GNAT superfamily N-acetyltransferase
MMLLLKRSSICPDNSHRIVRSRGDALGGTVFHLLREGEERVLFDFARGLPERGSWGRKTRCLRGGYGRFRRFFQYVRAFQPNCSLVAEENGKIVGFVTAVYSSRCNRELSKRYQCGIEKRAHILAIGFDEGRKDILKGLVKGLSVCFSKEGIKGIEYPTFGSVCLTTATDVLTPENVDALLMFREAGFRISDCYYSMRLNLGSHPSKNEYRRKRLHFQVGNRRLKLMGKNQVLARFTWTPIQQGRTSIGVFVKKAYRRKGLGTALMAESLRHLKTKGVNSVELGVDGNNLAALKLYRKFGFELYKTQLYLMIPC